MVVYGMLLIPNTAKFLRFTGMEFHNHST